MSHNHEYHMWREHVDHEVKVTHHEWTDHQEIMIGCLTCHRLIQVWEFIPEYEPIDSTAQYVIDFGD